MASAKKKKIKSRERARKKELKKELVRYELRRKVKKSIKKQISSLFSETLKTFDSLSKNNLEEKKKTLSQLYKTLDSKESKGLITKGRSNRLKSRCTVKFNKLFLNQKSKTEKNKN